MLMLRAKVFWLVFREVLFMFARFRLIGVVLGALLALQLSAATALAQVSLDARVKLLGGFTPAAEDQTNEVRAIMATAQWQNPRSNPNGAAIATINGAGSLFSQEGRQIMDTFFGNNLRNARAETRNLLYFFGGPDSLYPFVIFPNLERMVLVGLEAPGGLPDTAALARANALGGKMAEVAQAAYTVTRQSYFITNQMGNLREFGTSTIIAIGLASHGYRITNFEQIALDDSGNVIVGRGYSPGVRVSFTKQNGQRGEVLYFQTDLSNGGMNSKPQFQNFIRNNPFESALYKAAMYAPHNGMFNFLNNLVLNKVRYVVQNDDGIPFHQMRQYAANFSVRFFGLYSPPSGIFGVGAQQDLVAAYAQSICAGRPDARDSQIWAAMWGNACNRGQQNFGFASMTWEGSMPFRYGYGAVSGPGVAAGVERNRLGSLIVLERR